MHNFNTPSGSQFMAENCWNNSNVSSEVSLNSSITHHDYYESKILLEKTSLRENNSIHGVNYSVDHDFNDAISFLGSDTDLLQKAAQEPVSVRVVWNLLENVSRVYLPKVTSSSEQETICLSVKGDPYSVRENGVMLDALNYVRMLFSEQARTAPSY